jgi:isoquinoline 1-oxidoreductase alpha subunit
MIKLKINGQEQNWDGDPNLSLLWYLRDEVGLTGTKYGCGQALCGACTVVVDKEVVRSCITSVSDVAGATSRLSKAFTRPATIRSRRLGVK